MVFGLGVTGLACVRHLRARGEAVVVVDTRAAPPGLAALRREHPDVAVSLGPGATVCLEATRRIVVSPGVSPREPLLDAARGRGIEVVGDIELFAREAPAGVVAITGSNGKSTVTSLLGAMARGSGRRVALGGNLGPAALSLLEALPPELYVLELSSFQLESVTSLDPVAATVLNVSPDHMDRYDSLEAYAASKARVFGSSSVMVLNRDDPLVMAMSRPGRRSVQFTLERPGPGEFGVCRDGAAEWLAHGERRLLAVDALRLAGRHNVANALAALALAHAVGWRLDAVLPALAAFAGLPHRCEWVGGTGAVDWFNDSKGTNVGATVAAIRGLAARRPLVLIAGGDGKGADFRPLAAAVRGAVRAVVLLGRDGPLIRTAIEDAVPVVDARDMPQAVARARELAQPGDAVLLSPACASFDMYRSYEERGDAFRAAVAAALEG